MKIYICPGSASNIADTITNRATFSFMSEDDEPEYMWALNDRRVNTHRELSDGDLFIFGRASIGWNYIATFKSKRRIAAGADDWRFKSPTGLDWTRVFYLNEPDNTINLSHADMRYILGHKGVQTQTKLRDDQVARLRERIPNHV